MRDSSLLIVIIGAFLVSVCSSDSQSFDKSTEDGVVRMASEALVVKSYKEAESSTTSTTKSQASRFEEFQIYQGVMGRPGIDFPVYPHIPATSFTCRGVKKSGYYADLETDCQVFHICDGNRKISFLCPNGTIFRQSHLICDWWFRVDCGKSVELYEESAEQLAADQKIYKARSEERERRRKLGKTAAENGEEVTSSEVYALDEPFHVRNRQQEQRKNQLGSITTRAPPSRNAFEGRKAERHSKKVVDSGITDKFPNYSREKQNGRVTEKTRTTKTDGRIGATIIPVNIENRAKVSFIDTPATPSVESTTAHKGRQHTPNSISFVSNKENIQPAESGSLVEDLKQRTGNFVYNYRTGSEVSNNFGYNTNSKINQTVEFATNYSRNTDRVAGEVYNEAFEARNGGSSGTFGAQNGGTSGTFAAQSGGNSGAFTAQNGGTSGTFVAQSGGSSETFAAQSEGSSGTFGAQNGGSSGTFAAQSGGNSGTFGAQNGGNSGAFTAHNGGSSGAFVAQTVKTSGTFGAQNGGSSGTFVAQSGGSSGAFAAQNGGNSGAFAAQNGGNSGAFTAHNGGSSGAFAAQTVKTSGTFGAQNGGSSGAFGAQNGGSSGTFVAQNGGSSGTFAAQSGGNGGTFVAQSGGNGGTFVAQNGGSSGTFVAQNGGSSGTFVAQNGGSSGTFAAQSGGNGGTFAAQNGGSDEYNNRNINFNYNDRRTGEQTSRLKIAYNDGRTRKTAFENSNQKTETPNDFDVTAYTTEFFNYESKRTNFVDRQETITPTFQTTKILQSSKYRSTTPVPAEPERQFFAETASFASNRGGKSYSDFQNQYNALQKGIVTTTTTASPYKTTLQNTFPTTQSRYSTNFIFDQNSYRTSTYRPVKQHSRRVTTYPTTQPQTTFATRIWQTTTSQPFVETTINERFTVEDIYFTTPTQEREVESATEIQSFGSTPKPDVDITLQELNINKTPQPATGGNVSYDDLVREGLEVPPSSGPNAIRTFALYFATTNSNQEEGRTTTYLRSNDSELTTTLTPFEIKKKEVVKQVDELVQRSFLNTSDHVNQSEELPNSLTHHTQNSYSALFPVQQEENHTSASSAEGGFTEIYETTAFESFTEEPNRINKELTKNDLDGSQSRGLVEPDTDYGKVSPDLRELAQVFTKALSAYLDDPEAFRRVLSEIRPTEPTDSEVSSSNPLEYPSATQEDDEVLDFSDVTKSSYKKKTSTASGPRETTTVFSTDVPVTNGNEIENLVLPVNHTSWATNLELTAPLFESLDQSQSSYYTPPSYTSTTNAIAEEINNEFTVSDRSAPTDSNEAIDSYFPVRDNNDASSLPRYGGFQNNSKSTTKYSPYGAELTSTTYRPYGADLTATAVPNGATTNVDVTTFNPNNVTSFFSHFAKNESEEGEIQLAKELNNLVLLQKFTTPRGSEREPTTPEPSLSTVHLTSQNDVNVFQDVKLGNGEILEKSVRSGKALQYPETTLSSNQFEPDAKEINLELSPPSSTPKGFLITYSIGVSSSEPATYLPKATTPVVHPTTFSPSRQTTYTPAEDTHPPATDPQFENFSERLERLTNGRTSAYRTTTPPATTTLFFKSINSFERLAQLQETLMFNSNNVTLQQRDQARVSVVEMIDKMNMTDSTASTLMKMMEMAAKNETYRRLVLLLVNDKSGKNKTVEESRLDLLKALLTPVINPPRTVVPIPETSRLVQTEQRRRSISRRGKSITSDNAINAGTLTTTTIAPKKSSGERKTKKGRGLARAESNYSSGLGNLGVIKRTIENSKNKQVRINSLDDAILDSDSRAVDLLRSLYSLAARWG